MTIREAVDDTLRSTVGERAMASACHVVIVSGAVEECTASPVVLQGERKMMELSQPLPRYFAFKYRPDP